MFTSRNVKSLLINAGAGLLLSLMPPPSAEAAEAESPIEHVVIIVGENRSFDHLFATYEPPPGQDIANLLSKGIITPEGEPGPNFSLAKQYYGELRPPARFSLKPFAKEPYEYLPPPMTGGAHEQASDEKPPPFATLAAAAAVEGGSLPAAELPLLTTGATGLPRRAVDTRIADVEKLPPGPFSLPPGVGYADYAGGPVHRFYQMWQQLDCDAAQAGPANPSGCLADLFAWVEVSVGAGSNGAAQPPGMSDGTTGEGATALGFYNIQQGDLPYFTSLARQYLLHDNYHQPAMGGTGVNSIMLGAADAYYFADGHGQAATPPQGQIENPDPREGANNWYTQDGYKGGSYSNCSDPSAPGVGAVLSYLASLPNSPKPNCETGHYYLLNNYEPGYRGDGSLSLENPFTLPPSPVRTIADVLLEKNISWKYYGDGWNNYLKNLKTSVYCNICNPFLYETAIMTSSEVRMAHLKDTADLYDDIERGELPAVSFVKPGIYLDGHPASSRFDLFEAFTRKIVEAIKSKPDLFAHTAIFITVDEGGGYYDSGYIQPLDFFGDGTRIPLIVVSPFTTGGRVAHEYADHISILKFIERNWRLPTISARSRDNLPNPVSAAGNPYVPTNSPAVDDLFGVFEFGLPAGD
ncbi:MAG TPA: alkaline phosphatase family protein [Methylocella sp.]|nr:alkaline phosphatase family protein [Methylocella sp.]